MENGNRQRIEVGEEGGGGEGGTGKAYWKTASKWVDPSLQPHPQFHSQSYLFLTLLITFQCKLYLT